MIGAKTRGFAQIRFPLCLGLIGNCKNKIEVRVRKARRLNALPGLIDLLGLVEATQRVKEVGIKALNAHRNAGDPQIAKDRKFVGLHGGGCHFNGPFSRRIPEVLELRLTKSLKVFGGKQARRPPTPKDRRYNPVLREPCELKLHRSEVTVEITPPGFFLIKGTKVAGGGTKRDMNV